MQLAESVCPFGQRSITFGVDRVLGVELELACDLIDLSSDLAIEDECYKDVFDLVQRDAQLLSLTVRTQSPTHGPNVLTLAR